MTGISAKSKSKVQGGGKMMLYDAKTLDEVAAVTISDESVVRMIWHSGINQIVVSCGDGTVKILYDPKLSAKGALQCIVKEPRNSIADSLVYQRPIISPHALPQFRDTHTHPQRLREQQREDPVISKKPECPLQGPYGKGGRISQSGTVTQYVMRNIHKLRTRDEDARDVLLKYNDAANLDPTWVTPAYNSTQPKAIFDHDELKIEQLKLLEGTHNQKCPQCGLKFCVCNVNKLDPNEDEV
jgi:hypothetical protein